MNRKTMPTSDVKPPPPGPRYTAPARNIEAAPSVVAFEVACIRLYTSGKRSSPTVPASRKKLPTTTSAATTAARMRCMITR
jgi:hypothetical protein